MNEQQFQQKVFDHINADESAFIKIGEELKTIRENHLCHIEKDINTVKNDLKWLTKFFWIVAAGIIGIILTRFIK